MMKKALGKGLGVFLPDDYGILKDERYAEVEIEDIIPNPLQPRLKFNPESIEELARSIKETGVIQPIVVVPEGDNYKIIVGERRWRAAQKAGLKRIPALVRSIPKEKQLEVSLVENLHREGLNPLEVAFVFRRMMEELGFTQEAVADKVGKDRSSVTNYLRLLHLPQPVQDYLSEDKLSMGHARALAALEDADAQIELAHEIVRKNLSVRDVEKIVSRGKKKPPAIRKPEFDPDLRSVEEDLVRILGTKVTISGSRKKGTIKVLYFSLDDLNRIYDKLKGAAR
jgi:ParB family transcriptional regulator, chromosome partitioning protein